MKGDWHFRKAPLIKNNPFAQRTIQFLQALKVYLSISELWLQGRSTRPRGWKSSSLTVNEPQIMRLTDTNSYVHACRRNSTSASVSVFTWDDQIGWNDPNARGSHVVLSQQSRGESFLDKGPLWSFKLHFHISKHPWGIDLRHYIQWSGSIMRRIVTWWS